jgi:glycosyltransferase involved in cell wall biosynthesis
VKKNNSNTIFHIVTVPITFKFLIGHIRNLNNNGFEVRGVCSEYPEKTVFNYDFPIHTISINRNLNFFNDCIALYGALILFRRYKPILIHAHTPKGGFIGLLAGLFARVPVRVYTVHGLVYLGRTGLLRHALKLAERISCLFAHQVLCVSSSIRETMIADGVCSEKKSKVLLSGSISGVDHNIFSRSKSVMSQSLLERKRWNILPNELVIGYVGRFSRDKGMEELVTAWCDLSRLHLNLRLLLVGDFDSPEKSLLDKLKDDKKVIFSGWVEDVAPLMALMDMLVLPSYREGFGMVLIEAASMSIPTIATIIPGCVDAIKNGETGILVPPRNSKALMEAMKFLLENHDIGKAMGIAGRKRAINEFSQVSIEEALLLEYKKNINALSEL